MSNQWEAPEHHVRYDILHGSFMHDHPSNIQRCYDAEHGELVCKIIKARCKVLNLLSELDNYKYEYDPIPRQLYNTWTQSLDQW